MPDFTNINIDPEQIYETITKFIAYLSTLSGGSLFLWGILIGKMTRLMNKIIFFLLLVALAAFLLNHIPDIAGAQLPVIG